MEYQRFPQYTSKYTNVIVGSDWRRGITDEQIEWLVAHEGGYYHIHRSGTAVKFEHEEDATLFILRWL